MTICITSTISLQYGGGVDTFNKNFTQLFSSFQHKVIFVWVDLDSTTEAADSMRDISEWVTVVTLSIRNYKGYQQFKHFLKGGGSQASRSIAAGYALRSWLTEHHKQYNIDIIEASDGNGIGSFLIANHLPPVILTAHGSNLQVSKYDYVCFDEQGKVIKRLEQICYDHVDAIISHSPINTENIKKLTRTPVYTLPILWQQENVSLENNSEEKYGLAAGKLRYIKGAETVCKALQLLANQHPDITIKWIGNSTKTMKGATHVSTYLQKTYPLIFGKSFQWKEGVPHHEVLKEMAKAQYILIASLWETFNYVALEAAALGKPVIITNTTGASFLFTHGVNALVIDSDNEKSLTEALIQISSSKELRDRLGKNALELVKERFNAKDIVDQRIAVYTKIIAERKISQTNLEENIQFVHHYLTPRRKAYFILRSLAKWIYLKLKFRKSQILHAG